MGLEFSGGGIVVLVEGGMREGGVLCCCVGCLFGMIWGWVLEMGKSWLGRWMVCIWCL